MKNKIDPNSLGELQSKVVTIKRVSKTVKGGRNMRFTALVIVGDQNGHVGYGLGKAVEIPEAIRKGEEAAKKNMVAIARNDVDSIPYDNIGVFGSANVLLPKVPVSSPAARPVRFWNWPAFATSLRSLWVPITKIT